ncbi:MAG TPA: hypothetical protein VK665_03240 [Candidatus Elarobacter sp.]|nr:hypothetical protein [Candidatus Elarobacter sp.]
MNLRLIAALASAATIVSAGAASAQTTMAPTPMPVVGPTTTPNAMPNTTTIPAAMPPARTMAPMDRPLPIPRSALALDARYLRGTRTATGYRLTGQAEVRDACTAAKFQRLLGDIFPPFFNVVQYRRPGTLGLLCIQRLTWVTIAPLNVTSAAPPRWVSVHTAKGTTRVPIR